MSKAKKRKPSPRATEPTNEQLYALWAVVVEMGDNGVKGYVDRDMSALLKIDPDGDFIRDVHFPTGIHGAIVFRNRGGVVTGRLYRSAASLEKAWNDTDTRTEYPPWA